MSYTVAGFITILFAAVIIAYAMLAEWFWEKYFPDADAHLGTFMFTRLGCTLVLPFMVSMICLDIFG